MTRGVMTPLTRSSCSHCTRSDTAAEGGALEVWFVCSEAVTPHLAEEGLLVLPWRDAQEIWVHPCLFCSSRSCLAA